MEYSYFPGCSLEVTAKPYDASVRAVSRVLDIKLNELEDWNCCGATSYISIRELVSFAISARNLAIAEKKGKDLVTVCPACYTVLNKANINMQKKEDIKKTVDEALATANLKYDGTVKVRHLLDVIVNDVGLKRISPKVKKRLEGLKIAPYYGCQISRPHGTFDDPEFPMTMDNLFSALGAEVVNFPMKAQCCGGMLMTTEPEGSLKLIKNLLQCAQDNKAELIITACPLCEINLEGYQNKVNKKFKTNFSIPAIYFSQLLGVALGLSKEELFIGKELVSAEKILDRFYGGLR
jgi:heterodisulfide reductase subunit B